MKKNNIDIKVVFAVLIGTPLGVIGVILVTVGALLQYLFVRFYKSYDYREWLKSDLADCRNILELGCGYNSPLLQIGYGIKTKTVDIWQPYVDYHNERGDYASCKQADILAMEYPEKMFDAVVICDVMEHLPRKKVIDVKLFEKMEKAALKKVIIFTPNGFIENDEVDGDPYQRHVSAWEPEDYQIKGYEVYGATGYRSLLGKASLPKRPHNICAMLAMISKPFILNRPKMAWHSYAIKRLK